MGKTRKKYKNIATGIEAYGTINEKGWLVMEIGKYTLGLLDCLPLGERQQILYNYETSGNLNVAFYPQQFFEIPNDISEGPYPKAVNYEALPICF